MRSRRLAVGRWIVMGLALVPIAALAQQPKVQRPRAVVRDTGRVTIDPRTIVPARVGVNAAAVAPVVKRRVPAVVGRTVALASEVIAKGGLVAKVERVAARASPPSPGIVVAQRPSAGDSLPAGSPVTIFVDTTRADTTRSDPPDDVGPLSKAIPNLAGDSPAVARERLRKIGFVAVFSPRQFADSERAKVVKQDPSPGTIAPLKSPVRLGLIVDNTTTVPNVLRMTSDQARAKVTDAQLLLVEQQAPDSNVPVGRVVAQRPQGGMQVAMNSRVTVTYSSGPLLFRVPNLADNTRETAEATIVRNRFRVGSVDTIVSTGGFGRVVWQEPRADSLVPGGSLVRFHVGKQAPVRQVVVPSLTGLTLETAPARLRRLLRLHFVDSLPSSAPASTIVRQDPAAGDSAIAGSDVHVWTAYPPPPPRIDSVAVPRLIGLTRNEAVDRIRAARLGVGRQLTTDAGTPGRISRQEPPADTRQPVNAPVSFWIVSTQLVEMTTVPSVTNHLLDSALTLLDSARLTGRLNDNNAIREPDHWAVISQQPVAGTRVRVQSTVRLVVEHLVESVAVPSVIDSLTARAEVALATGGFGMSVRQRRFAWTLRETVVHQEPTGGASATPGGLVRVDLSYPLGFIMGIALPLLGGGIPAGTWVARKILKKDPGSNPPPLDIRVQPTELPTPAPELEFPPNDDFVKLSITLDFLDWTLESVVDGSIASITLDRERTDA